MERDSEAKLRQLIDYQERYSEAAVHTASKKGGCRQRMEIGYQLRDEWASIAKPLPSEGVELMRMADRRIEQLVGENEAMRERTRQLEGERDYLDKQVKSRNIEIERLNQTILPGPSNLGGNMANEQLIAQQSTQIEYLREQNRELELRVDQLISAGRMEIDKIMDRTEWLERRNQVLERKVGQSPSRREVSVNSAHGETEELIRRNRELELYSEQNLRDLAGEREENSRLNQLLQKCHEDRQKLTNRLSQKMSGDVMEETGAVGSGKEDGVVRAERDQLRSMLGKLEMRVVNVQSQVGSLRREKEEFKRLAEEKTASERRLEREREDLAEEIIRLRGAAKGRDRSCERVELGDLDRALCRLREELEQERENNEGLLEENERLNDQLSTVQEQCREQVRERSEVLREKDRLREEMATRERAMGELRTRLRAKEDEIGMLEEDLKETRAKMEREWAERDSLAHSKTELGKTMRLVDEENHRLSQEVDDKAEMIHQLEQSLEEKREEVSRCRGQESRLGEELRVVREVLLSREQETDSLRRQLELSNSENERYAVASQRSRCENERVVDEMAALVAQCKQLQQGNFLLRERAESLQKELEMCRGEVESANQSLFFKNDQIEELREDYGKLSRQLQEVNGDKSKLAEDVLKYRQCQVEYQKQIEGALFENKQNLETIREREKEIEGLARELALLEDRVNFLEGENAVVKNDLKHSGELAAKLGMGRDQLQTRLASRDSSCSRMREEAEERSAQLEEMRIRLQSQANKTSDINEALQSSRDKIYRQELTIEEREARIRSLEERLRSLGSSK